MDNAIPDIDGWKAHILRAAHQDTAKSAVVENLANNEVLIIMDWAMKFLPIRLPPNATGLVPEEGKVMACFCRCQKGG